MLYANVLLAIFLSMYACTLLHINNYYLLDCHNRDDLDLFITESVIMKNFNHKNILELIGVSVGVANDITRPYIILPFMVNKDLRKFLRSKRSEVGNNLEALLKVCVSVHKYVFVYNAYLYRQPYLHIAYVHI